MPSPLRLVRLPVFLATSALAFAVCGAACTFNPAPTRHDGVTNSGAGRQHRWRWLHFHQRHGGNDVHVGQRGNRSDLHGRSGDGRRHPGGLHEGRDRRLQARRSNPGQRRPADDRQPADGLLPGARRRARLQGLERSRRPPRLRDLLGRRRDDGPRRARPRRRSQARLRLEVRGGRARTRPPVRTARRRRRRRTSTSGTARSTASTRPTRSDFIFEPNGGMTTTFDSDALLPARRRGLRQSGTATTASLTTSASRPSCTRSSCTPAARRSPSRATTTSGSSSTASSRSISAACTRRSTARSTWTRMAAQLGITKGTAYDLELFHAERHTTASHFRVDTNFVFVDCGTVIP